MSAKRGDRWADASPSLARIRVVYDHRLSFLLGKRFGNRSVSPMAGGSRAFRPDTILDQNRPFVGLGLPITMSVGIYRYGERGVLKGLCIGVTRFPPRGVPRNSPALRACYDVWLPLLAPSRKLIGAYKKGGMRFSRFAARYRKEMQKPDPRHVIETLCAVAQHQPIHLGCYCADELRCHRSVLRELIRNRSEEPSAPRAKPARGIIPDLSLPIRRARSFGATTSRVHT